VGRDSAIASKTVVAGGKNGWFCDNDKARNDIMNITELREQIAHDLEEESKRLSPSEEGETSSWDGVVKVLQTHYHKPDVDAARVLYSAVAAHGLKGQPVWPMVVAPASTMKT